MRRIGGGGVFLWVVVVAAAVARACFVGAPWQLFDNRRDVRDAAPVNSFAWEAAHLVAAPVGLPPPAILPGDAVSSGDARRAAGEAIGLTPAQSALVARMRAAPDAVSAQAAGSDLPEGVRLYTAGAGAFARKDLASARADFAAVLALRPSEAAPRAVWAAFMLGRSAKTPDEGVEAFGRARALAADGNPDPLGLAIAGLGEEARLRLDAKQVPGAVALYAAQAAAGSDEAVQSLRMVAEKLMAQPDGLAEAVRDGLTQRLLVVHALALTGDYLHALHTGGTLYDIGADGFFPPDNPDTGPIRKLFDAIGHADIAGRGTDRLASLAYQLGKFGAARDLAAKADTPLALWIRAKIALHDGDDETARRAMSLALERSALASPSLEGSSAGLLHGEAAVWALGRSDFQGAMAVLWPVAGTYWGDVAYLAEDVLTTDELKAFTDTHGPVAAPRPAPGSAQAVEPYGRLRSLLARRLMRDGRYDEAAAYFDAPARDQPDTKADAAAFAKAVGRSSAAFWALDRAQAGWQAALLLRERGMEIMGTETAPDESGFSGGALSTGYGPEPGGPVNVTPAELARFRASRAKPDLRFHYRYVAADLAVLAADALPARSQAYAAILCQAAGWMVSTHAGDRAKAIYQRYLSRGAHVGFARHFGHDCPAPDFASAGGTGWRLLKIDVRDFLHRKKAVLF